MRDFFSGANLRKDAGRPNRLRTLFNVQTGSFAKEPRDIAIRDSDGRPLWFVHPMKRVDIAILPLSPTPEGVALYPLNDLANTPLRIKIGMEVFILGYPFEIKRLAPQRFADTEANEDRAEPTSQHRAELAARRI